MKPTTARNEKVRGILRAIHKADEVKIDACKELYTTLVIDEVGDEGWEYLTLGRKYSREPRQ